MPPSPLRPPTTPAIPLLRRLARPAAGGALGIALSMGCSHAVPTGTEAGTARTEAGAVAANASSARAASAPSSSTGADASRPTMPDAAPRSAPPFRNNYGGAVDKPFGDLLRWRWNAWRQDLPRPPVDPVASVAPALERLATNRVGTDDAKSTAQPSVTWIGHATTLVQAGGLNVLTDPHFSDRASPVLFAGPKRAQPPGILLPDLPPIDVVVISHNHYDHLDRISVLLLNARSKGRTLFLVPLGLKAWMAEVGITNVVELNWWQSHTVRGTEFALVPVQHWSARGLGDRNRTLWGGWAVTAPGLAWYFSGDAGYSPDFADTARWYAARHGRPDGAPAFDLALMAIGAYEPRWFMTAQHMNPDESVQAHRDLRARRSLGIHWGTFNLTDEPLDQPPKDLAVARRAAGLADDDFFLLRIGETRWLEPRGAAPAAASASATAPGPASADAAKPAPAPARSQ